MIPGFVADTRYYFRGICIETHLLCEQYCAAIDEDMGSILSGNAAELVEKGHGRVSGSL